MRRCPCSRVLSLNPASATSTLLRLCGDELWHCLLQNLLYIISRYSKNTLRIILQSQCQSVKGKKKDKHSIEARRIERVCSRHQYIIAYLVFSINRTTAYNNGSTLQSSSVGAYSGQTLEDSKTVQEQNACLELYCGVRNSYVCFIGREQ